MDELLAYLENDYYVGHIKVHNPTLREIARAGEENFWNMVCSITATRYDVRLYLWSIGIDFDTVHWWQMVCQRVKDKVLPDCSLIMPDIDFRYFTVCIDKELEEMILYDPVHDIRITEEEFAALQEYWRTTLNLPVNDIRNGNAHTRKWRLERDLEKLEREQRLGIKHEFHSVLKNYISASTNCAGFKYNWHTVRDLPINVFMDALTRVQMIKQSDNLIAGIYAGGISYKEMKNKERLDWLREIKPIKNDTN